MRVFLSAGSVPRNRFNARALGYRAREERKHPDLDRFNFLIVISLFPSPRGVLGRYRKLDIDDAEAVLSLVDVLTGPSGICSPAHTACFSETGQDACFF
jgi:hypothetical protein